MSVCDECLANEHEDCVGDCGIPACGCPKCWPPLLAERACDWCGDFEDICGPLEGVLCGDGSTMRLCEDCREGLSDD